MLLAKKSRAVHEARKPSSLYCHRILKRGWFLKVLKGKLLLLPRAVNAGLRARVAR